MHAANSVTTPAEGLTAGSLTIIQAGAAVRAAAAQVRERYAAALAARAGVDVADVEVADGTLAAGDTRASYSDLADDVDLGAPAAETWTELPPQVVGTDVPRVDLPDKVAGRPRYLHDLRVPDQLFARVVRPATPGARLVAVPDAPEGTEVVRDGDFLALVGPREQTVHRAVDGFAASVEWEEAALLPDEDDLRGFLRTGPHDTTVVEDDAPESAPSLRSTYSRPFLAHASIAPSCGMARWDESGSRVSVWSSSQGVRGLHAAIAQALGLEHDAVEVQHVESAGSYGHNGADDAAFDAVLVARAHPGKAVHVTWSRADELSWGPLG